MSRNCCSELVACAVKGFHRFQIVIQSRSRREENKGPNGWRPENRREFDRYMVFTLYCLYINEKSWNSWGTCQFKRDCLSRFPFYVFFFLFFFGAKLIGDMHNKSWGRRRGSTGKPYISLQRLIWSRMLFDNTLDRLRNGSTTSRKE